MAATYTSKIRLTQQGDGDNPNSWGTVLNNGVTSLVDDAIAAISNNAAYIETHFTIDKKLPGRDNKFAILPEQMKFICDFRDKFLKMREFQGLDFQEVEQSVFAEARGRWSK